MCSRFLTYFRFARALKSRPYAMVRIGQTISRLGDSIFYVALAWQVLLMTHSGTAMGIVLAAAMIPGLMFMLIGGVAADRLPRKKIILWSDGVRGLLVLCISILGFTGMLQFWHLVVESFIFGIVDGFFNPTIIAIMPDLVEKDDLPSANALNTLGSNLTQLIGPLLGAGLIALISSMGVFALNSLSFFLSLGFLLPVHIPERHIHGASLQGIEPEDNRSVEGETSGSEYIEVKRQGFRGVIADVQEGLFYVGKSSWLWVSILCLSLGNLGIVGPLVVAMPKLILDVYGQGAWLLGLISAVEAIGALLALVLVGHMTRFHRRGLLSYLLLVPAGMSILMIGLPWSANVFSIVGPIASVIFGFSSTFFNTIWYTILQETIPGDKLGRVVSLDMLGSFALIPVSEALSGILTDQLGPAKVFVIGGSLALCINVLPLLVQDVRKMK